MKALLIYNSWHKGNTKKLAEAMAQAVDAEAVTVEQAEAMDLSGCELLGFGSGIAFGKHDDRLLEFAGGAELSGKRAFTFSTHGKAKQGKYHDALERILKERGAEIAGAYSCPGWDCYGPFKLVGGINKGRPNEDDLRKGAEFLKNLPAGRV